LLVLVCVLELVDAFRPDFDVSPLGLVLLLGTSLLLLAVEGARALLGLFGPRG